MRSTEERMQTVFCKAACIKTRRQQKKIYASMVVSGVFSLALVVICAYTIPNVAISKEYMGNTTGFSASIFANSQMLSYVIVGIVTVLLGMFLTVICVLLHKKARQLEENNHDY